MKKIFYLFAITAFVFTSCNPLEDVIEEVDALTANDALVDDLVLTLSDDDYTADVEDGGFGFSFPNFNSPEQAKELLPGFLSAKYPQLGVTYSPNGEIKKKSTALISYKLFNKKNDEKSLIVYTVTSADYIASGHSFGNFSSLSDITEFLDTKYPDAADRLLVSLTYEYFNGTKSTLTNGFINNKGTWEMATGITVAEYTAMGEGRPQFSSEKEALTKIALFAKNRFQYDGKVAGDIEGVMYELYVKDTQDLDGDKNVDESLVYSFVTFVIYDGANWSTYNNVVDQSIKLGHDGTTWVPDNTIKYTLTPEDFELVGNGFRDNFDVREGEGEETVESRRVKINTILLNNFPDLGIDQKFSVSYAVWAPGNEVYVMNLIHDGTEYILQ